jgi:ABC-type polysaccharide/polyol phosphate transport system ATPase subunit
VSAVITVDDVSKQYRLYHERNQSLKAAIMRRARVRYEEFWALRDVSLQVPEGSTFALIGENGSGKSTLLKCMARILRPEKGRIETRGKISALLELGAGFHPELTGRENVFLNGSILGLSKKQITERFDEIVDFAGLEHFIDTPVKNYSSGMYVRLGFSVAINVDPDILLIDEVLAVGDTEFQRRCMEKFDEFRQSGKTVVIVSHAVNSIRNLADTVGWLEHGVLRRLGKSGDVIDEYLSETHADRERRDPRRVRRARQTSPHRRHGCISLPLQVLRPGSGPRLVDGAQDTGWRLGHWSGKLRRRRVAATPRTGSAGLGRPAGRPASPAPGHVRPERRDVQPRVRTGLRHARQGSPVRHRVR